MSRCYVCWQPEDFPRVPRSELRPYGPHGEDICFGCMTAEPGREAVAQQHFTARVADAERKSPHGVAVITDGAPPTPLLADDDDT